MFGIIRAANKLREEEQALIERIRNRERVATNVNVLHAESQTLGQKLADRIAQVAGSWGFIIAFLSVLVLWMLVNTYFIATRPFDPYPFILLNLVLSCVAAIQAPVILMSQNRQATRDRLQSDSDYAVNLKAEMEIEALHQKLDTLRESQWAELVEMQRRQIEYLERLLGVKPAPGGPPDPEPDSAQ